MEMSAVEIKFQSKTGNVALRRNIPEVGSQGRSNFSPKGIRSAQRRGNRRTPSWGGGEEESVMKMEEET